MVNPLTNRPILINGKTYLDLVKKGIINKIKKSPRRPSPKKSIVKVHDNGGRPFQIKITPNVLEVLELKDDKYKHLMNIRNYVNLWIGEDECDKDFSYGNSLLVELPRNKYLFLGMEIVSFTLNKKIKKYFSPVGNNDVPYPWFVDENNNVYLLSDPREIEYFLVSERMMKTFGNCSSSSLCDRNQCKSSDPYKELWKNKSIPENLIRKLPSKVIRVRN
jgi:hypothetical protein